MANRTCQNRCYIICVLVVIGIYIYIYAYRERERCITNKPNDKITKIIISKTNIRIVPARICGSPEGDEGSGVQTQFLPDEKNVKELGAAQLDPHLQ